MENLPLVRPLRRLVERYARVNWAMADQALLSAVNFATGVLLARALGPSEFGVFSLAWLAVLFVYSLQFALISAPMLSIAAKYEEKDRPRYYGAVFTHFGLTTAASFSIVLLGSLAFGLLYPPSGAYALALPIAFATIGYQVRDFFRRYFFSLERPASAFILDFIGYGGQLAVLFALIQTENLTVATALWGTAAIAFIAAGVGLLRIAPVVFRRSSFYEVLKRHWEFARWLLGSAVLDMFTGQIALLVSGAFLGAAAAGAVRAAQTLLGIANILFHASQNVLPSRAAALFKEGGAPSLRRFILQALLALTGVTLCMALFFGVAPDFWLTTFFGEAFDGYGELVRWFGIVFVVKAVTFSIGSGLWAIEKTRPIFIGYVVASTIGLASAYPLLQVFGATGAVLTALIGEIFLVVVTGLHFLRLTKSSAPDESPSSTELAPEAVR